jgi:hypothetical protein
MTAVGNLLYWVLEPHRRKAKGGDCSAIASCRKRQLGCAAGSSGDFLPPLRGRRSRHRRHLLCNEQTHARLRDNARGGDRAGPSAKFAGYSLSKKYTAGGGSEDATAICVDGKISLGPILKRVRG